MSLILEALKRSEAERQEAAGNRRDTTASGPTHGQTTARRAILAVAGAGILAIAWWTMRSPGQQEPQSSPVAIAPGPREINEIPSSPVMVKASEPLQTPEAPVSQIVNPAPVQTIAESKPAPVEQARLVEMPERVESNPPAKPKLVTLDMPAIESLGVTPQTAPAIAATGDQPFGTFAQLPAALQAEIGDLTLNVLVYADQAADRFVLINLRRYQSGDQLNERLSVSEIRADGVVLDHDGRLFILDTQF